MPCYLPDTRVPVLDDRHLQDHGVSFSQEQGLHKEELLSLNKQHQGLSEALCLCLRKASTCKRTAVSLAIQCPPGQLKVSTRHEALGL